MSAAFFNQLADPELPKHPRARLLFALAQVLDAQGDCARAAACLHEANAVSLELTRVVTLLDEKAPASELQPALARHRAALRELRRFAGLP